MLRKVVKKKTKVVKVVFNYEDKDKISKYHKSLTLVIWKVLFQKADGFGRLDQKPEEKRFISLVITVI